MKQTRKRRLPVAKPTMPAQIPDTPENVAKALLNTAPKKKGDWDYLKKAAS